jgi:hypothetical protein
MRAFIKNYTLSEKERAVYNKSTATISYVATKNDENGEIELIAFLDDEEIFFHIYGTDILAVNDRMPDDNVMDIFYKMDLTYSMDVLISQYTSDTVTYEEPMFGCLCDECKSKMLTKN